jgi:hypothetical protein
MKIYVFAVFMALMFFNSMFEASAQVATEVNFSSVSDRFICPDGNATFVADA